MIPVALNLKGKNVLIVGAGKVALKKARKYILEGAHVYVVSIAFREEFKQLDVQMVCDSYHSRYLNEMFLVYAATQDRDINHQIVMDCTQRNIICGSATKDGEASFYGMAYREDEAGMVAYSSHQQFPYSQPLLDQMMTVIEKEKPKMLLLAKLRPYILKTPHDDRQIFSLFYHAPLQLLQFLWDSLTDQYGVIVIYHKNKFDNSYHFDMQPIVYLSIEEFHDYQTLFRFPVRYICVPLVMSEGMIYQRMTKDMSSDLINTGPVIQSKDDIIFLMDTWKSERKQIWVLHHRQDDRLKNMFKTFTRNIDIYDFHEEIVLDKEEMYELKIMILGHGKHYADYQNLVKDYQRQGYDIVFGGNLLDCQEMKNYLIKRIKMWGCNEITF